MPYSIAQHLHDSANVQTRMADHSALVEDVAAHLIKALQGGHKLVDFGNGGSAADAQHFAAELVGRFEKERDGLPAIALSTDTSAMTAISNDFGYDRVFARQVQAHVQKGDVVVGISTSGNAASVLRGIEEARKKGAWTVGLTGQSGGQLKSTVDVCLCVPSQRTAHIQECHISLIHAICACVDQALITARV
jgi:D-sedoheptulose 7-phosphate isomerase